MSIIDRIESLRTEAEKRVAGQPTAVNWQGFDLFWLLDTAASLAMHEAAPSNVPDDPQGPCTVCGEEIVWARNSGWVHTGRSSDPEPPRSHACCSGCDDEGHCTHGVGSRTPCPTCPHWLELHNPDGSCGCGMNCRAVPALQATGEPPIPPHSFVGEQRSPTHCLLFIQGGNCNQAPDAPIHRGAGATGEGETS